jgi:SAM-dependent methyltransferase
MEGSPASADHSLKSAETERAESFWNLYNTAAPDSYWSHPDLARTVNSKTDDKWFFDYIKGKYFSEKPARSALSLGCGNGVIDRIAYSRGIFEKVHGVDFSTAGIAAARVAAAEENVRGTYARVDFNNDQITGANEYDLIYDYASFHHVMNLENIMSQVERLLTDDGIFVLYGYCGPARFQWTPRVMELANLLMRRLPLRLRKTMPEVARSSIWEFLAADPSEAVRGPEVLDLARSYFDIIEEIDLGSTLSCPMFVQNMSHFNPDNESEQTILRLVFQFEDLLISEGTMGSDVKLLVCRRRPVDHFRPAR